MEPTTTLLHLSAALPMPRLAVLRPPASSDVSVEVGNVSTVVLGNERVAVDAILDDDACISWASTAMLESALEGFSHGLVLHGAPQGQLIPRLLLHLGDQIQQKGYQLWFTALELLEDQLLDQQLDLLATGPLERREPPRFVLHPGLGTHAVGASEVPISDHAELKEWISFSQKRRVLTSSCLHAASSRSHQLFFLRLEAGQIHSRLGIFDLRSSAPSRSVPADLTTLESVLQSCHHPLACKLTIALKDLLTGTWHGSVLAEGSRSSFRWLKAWARPRLLCSLTKGLPRSAQLELLQGEVQALKLQTPDETRSEALAQRSALILEFSKKPLDRRRLARERVKTYEWCGVMTEETQEVLQQELMTPYLLNMSDDASLAGSLMYLLQRGERTSIGSDPDNTIVLDGLGMLPNLCSIVNLDDFKLTLSRPDFAKDHVLVNGKTMAKDSIVLSHHDRICLGRAQMVKLHIPHQGVETIQESEEKLGLQPLECLLPEDLAGFLPPLPRQGFEVNFANLQHLLEHSESLRNLQYYVKDLLPKLSATAQLACFETLRKACYLVDEANMITREVRPEDQLHFEVDLVWDIFRHPEEVLVIRLLSYSSSPRSATTSSQVLHYWSYAQFQARLELMRDAHRAATRSSWSSWSSVAAKEELMDPWRESNLFPLRHLLSHALFDRPEVEDLKMQLAEMRQELQEKTGSLEKKAEIISQLNEQLMGVVSLTQEIQEEVGLQSPHGASPITVVSMHDLAPHNDGSEENFTMSVSASTISDGAPTAPNDARSRGFKVDKLSGSILQTLAPALLSQSSLTPPHCYRDLHR
ncbi:unnamed protein product [Cladocopium goreaui]|uniref:Kinesin-like protein KIF13A n=1 Tax=Cladocopium goreaui TaxID=2562237 RepID=A0A9P1BIN2_9DINO|nr:unnamed protein product [Cladocopium goreaui]